MHPSLIFVNVVVFQVLKNFQSLDETLLSPKSVVNASAALLCTWLAVVGQTVAVGVTVTLKEF